MSSTLSRSRRPELDLMRAVVVAGLVVFHSAIVFAAGTNWFVNDPRPSPGFTVFVLWGSLWGMPLLFLISGMSAWYAMRWRPARAFLAERLARLLVPLVTGLIALVPPMFYLHRMGQPGFREPYWKFWLRFFDPAAMAAGLPASGTWRSGGTEFDPGHLWFLFCLLIFSVALVPLFSWFRRPRGRRLIDGIAGAAERHGAVVLVAAVVPIMAVETARGPDTTTGGWERLTYVFPFLYGYLIASDRRLEAAIRRLRWPALGCAVIASLALAAGVRVLAGAGEVAARTAPQLSALQALAGWAWVVTIVGFAGAVAGRVRSRPPAQITPERGWWRRAVWYANQAVLPFYLLHQPVIVAVAWLAVRWHAPVAVKFAVVVTVSFALTVALYEAVVRRFRLGRFLFGMRPAATPRPWPIHERTVL